MIRALLLAAVAIACGGTAFQHGSGGLSADECVTAHEAIIANVRTVVEKHRDGCTQNSDCALQSSTISCEPGCQVAVIASQLDAFTADLGALDQQTCPTAPTGCVIEPYCVTAPAVCDAGTCMLAP